MSFKATINDNNNQLIWGKSLSTLSQINVDVFVTITKNGIILSSMNNTDTTMAKVRFPKDFFTEFFFDPKKIVFGEAGVQQIYDCSDQLHTIYSFKINGKYLSLLSLKQEDQIKEYVLSIDNSDGCSESLANKLILKMRTNSLLNKEYQVIFDPLESIQIILSLKYKQKFLSVYNNSKETKSVDPRLMEYFKTLQNELQEDMFNKGIANEHNIVTTVKNTPLTISDEINFLSFDQSILKNFVESIMSNVIEEIKLELTRNSLNIIGFTKAIYNMKSEGYLKQAVTVTNTCSAHDLEHYCIFSIENKENASRPSSRSSNLKKSITFKLRDFKIFLNGLNCWKTNDMIRIWFCQPGDPILFEIIKDGVILELVQVTDTDGRVEDSTPQETPQETHASVSPEKHISPIKKDNLVKLEKLNKPLTRQPIYPHAKRSLFVQDLDNDDEAEDEVEGNEKKFKFKRWSNQQKTPEPESNTESQSSESTSNTHQSEPAKRMRTTVEWAGTYDKDIAERKGSYIKQIDKAAYLAGLKRQALEEPRKQTEDALELENEEMGPTQVDQPKGLFDD